MGIDVKYLTQMPYKTTSIAIFLWPLNACHAMGVHLYPDQQDERYRWLVSQHLAQGLPDRDAERRTDKGK